MADQDFPYYIVLLTLGVCTGLFYEISIVTYRLFFHPLRSFPGPKLAAATFLYETFFDVVRKPGGQFIYELDRLHAKYGRVVRCNPDEIHVRDSEWYDVLYAGPGKVRNKWKRSNRANGSPGSVASTTQHELHRQRRGALNSYFSKKAVVSLEKDTRSKVDRACELLKANAEEGKVVNLGAVFTAITLDVITTYCYDACLNCIEEPDFAPRWQKLMNGLFEGVPIAKHFPQIMNAMQSLPPSILARLKPEFLPFLETKDAIGKQAREIWNAENDSTNSEKSAGDEKAKTIFHGIMHSRLPPEERAVERLVDEAFILIVAGGETTARVLTVILTHLLQNEDLFARVRQELDQVVDRDGSPDLPESRVLEDLPLVKAVVQEGVRMAAPVTNRQRLIAPNEDLKCNGFVIPRGTPTSMTPKDVLFDDSIFSDPNTFNPDRWLKGAAYDKRLDRYLVTFSKGNRNCLGINLAYSEMYLGVAALVSRFDMELHDFDRKRDLDIVRDCFVGLPSQESRGVWINLKVRPR